MGMQKTQSYSGKDRKQIHKSLFPAGFLLREIYATTYTTRLSQAGCLQRTTTDRSGYCEEHAIQAGRTTSRKSRHERGYGTKWDRLRLVVLEQR